MNERDSANTSKTDWERLRTMPDGEIDMSDIPPLGDEFFSNGSLTTLEGKVSIRLNVDEEVIGWYQRQGTNIQSLVNTALRDYADSHR